MRASILRFRGTTSLWVLLVVVVLGAVTALALSGLVPWRAASNTRATSGPPQIVSSTAATVSQPTSGAQVVVTAPSTSLAGTISDIFARNLTLNGPAAPWVAGTYTASTNTGDVKIVGGAGDLIELRVYEPTETPSEDVALVGYVPVPTDSACPDYEPQKISADSAFDVSFDTEAVFDQSWPVTAELGLYGQAFTDSAVLTSTNNTYNTNTPTLTISADVGDRAVLRLTDNYGNRTDVHFIVDTAVGATTYDPFPTVASYRPSGSHSVAERTGQAAIAGTGVLLNGLTFLTQHTLLSHRGRTLDTSVDLYYRSAMGYDGPVGMGWDWSLDSRIERVGGAGSYNWWPGNGLVHEGISDSDSPDGIFLQFSVTSSSYLLTEASGAELSFEIASGLLESITDEHGGTLEITRDAQGRVVSIEDDKGRVTRFSWFHTGRLAAVIDFGARTTLLDYTDDRELQFVTRPDGSVLEWGYDGGLLTDIWSAREAAGTARKILKNEYQSGVMHKQRDLYSMYLLNATTGSPTTFVVSPSGGPTAPSQSGVTVVRLTDGQGAVSDYGFGSTNGELRILRRHYNLDRRSANGYPQSSPDPDWIDHLYELNADNLLPSRMAKRHSGQTTQYPDLEIHEWTYLSPQDADPRARARLLELEQKGDGTGTAFSTTYEYPTAGAIYWPKAMTDAGGRVTDLQYSTTGQLLRSAVDDVSYTFDTPPATYDIVTEYEYDDGLLTKVWNPNRLHDYPSSPQPSTLREYYTTGFSEGWLERVDTLDWTGSPKLSMSYEYDLFGNVTRVTNQAGEVTDYTYDLLDRQVEESSSVILTRPGAPTTPVVQKRRNVYAGDELVEVQGLYRDDLGVVHDVDGNSGTESLIRLSRSETIESTATTGVTRVSRRSLEFDSGEPDGIGEESETRTIYDSNGNAVTHREFFGSGSTDYTETTSVYDSLGQLLRTTIDSQSASPDIDSWYAYDIYETSGKRLTHRYETGWAEPERTRYDLYGRRESSWTTKIELGDTSDATPITRFGFYRTDTKYGTNGQRVDEVSEVEKYALVGETPTWDGTGYELISRERSYHDEAGRQNRSETLRENGTTPTYTETRSILLPGGQVWKSYPQTVGSGVRVLETSRDSLDRVTAQEDKIGTSPQTVSASVTTYSATTGRVEKTTRIEWDEDELTTYDYETAYIYDARGRVTSTKEKGQVVPTLTSPPEPIEHRVAYDGLGRQTYSATWQGTTVGLISVRTLDLGGRGVEEKRGRGPEPLALYSKTTSVYDRKGRMLSSTEWDETVSPAGSRVTSYAYDGADRQVTVTLPRYSSGGTARTVSMSYDNLIGGKRETETTDPNGVTRTVTSNQMGQPLVETVTVPTGVTHITGATEVSYLYAGASGCGCSASGKAVEVRTSGGLKDTKVTRSYDLQGRVVSETIAVEDSPSWESHETVFSYDAAGRLSELTYPAVGSYSQTLQYLYRPDGALLELNQRVAGDWDNLVEYNYRGRSQIESRVTDNLPSSPVEVVKGSMGRDAFGRSGNVSWLWQPTSSTVLSEDIERDLEGVPTGRTREDARVSTFTYAGDNWLASETWEEANPWWYSDPSCSVGYNQERTLNGYGELIAVEETVSNPDHDPPACVNLPTGTTPRVDEWTLNRNGAGLVKTITGGTTLQGYGRATYRDRRFDKRIEHFQETTNSDPTTYTYDLAGNRTLETTAVFLELADWEGDIPAYCLWDVRDSITTDSQYDAWGRLTQTDREVDRVLGPGYNNGTSCNENDPVPPDDPEVYDLVTDYVYDGYGRIVFSQEAGYKVAWIDPETFNVGSPLTGVQSISVSTEEYRTAFLAGDVIATARRDGTTDEVGEWFRNPLNGQVQKGSLRDESDGSVVNQHTFLTGALRPGQVLGSNAASASGSGEANEWCLGLSAVSTFSLSLSGGCVVAFRLPDENAYSLLGNEVPKRDPITGKLVPPSPPLRPSPPPTCTLEIVCRQINLPFTDPYRHCYVAHTQCLELSETSGPLCWTTIWSLQDVDGIAKKGPNEGYSTGRGGNSAHKDWQADIGIERNRAKGHHKFRSLTNRWQTCSSCIVGATERLVIEAAISYTDGLPYPGLPDNKAGRRYAQELCLRATIRRRPSPA